MNPWRQSHWPLGEEQWGLVEPMRSQSQAKGGGGEGGGGDSQHQLYLNVRALVKLTNTVCTQGSVHMGVTLLA